MKFTWQPIRIAMLSLAAVLALGAARADTDPAKALMEINQWRSEHLKEAMDAKKTTELRGIIDMAAAKAKAAVEGVDAAGVDPAKGLDWARLFQMAQQPAKVIAAADRYLSTSPDSANKYAAELLEITSYVQLRDGAGLARLLNAVTPPDKGSAARLAITAGNSADLIAQKGGAQAALDLLTKLEKQTPWSELTTDQEKLTAESAAVSLAKGRSQVLKSSGKTAEALAALEAGKSRLAPNSRYIRQLDMEIAAGKLVGSPAPEIVRERGYGDFPGLAACKGKVVLIDFMAHWCGPCKASLPSMKQLYNDYHSQGLEIVSVTTYYGYFGAEKKLTPDAEFAKMDGFVKDEGMTWPVAFGPRTNMESYGVSGIPNFVLIDKTGKVHSVTVGYSPALFGGLRKSVESLLGVKVALR